LLTQKHDAAAARTRITEQDVGRAGFRTLGTTGIGRSDHEVSATVSVHIAGCQGAAQMVAGGAARNGDVSGDCSQVEVTRLLGASIDDIDLAILLVALCVGIGRARDQVIYPVSVQITERDGRAQVIERLPSEERERR